MKDYNQKIQKLNVFKIPMTGINLIEASAGTGKTFTIVLLYLRLLLGIGKNQKKIKKYPIQNILIVTFTDSSKEELNIRIHNGIQNLYLACTEKNSTDPMSILLLQEIKNIEEAIITLKEAQNNIDQISIYTIHGFCQSILQSHTFHLNINFEEKIIENEDTLYLQATQDFWRNCFYNLPENIIKMITCEYSSPSVLLKKIKPLLYMKSIIFKPKFIKNETLITYHNEIIRKINDFKKQWLKHNQFISSKIHNLNLNKKIYSKINVSRWIENITLWSKSITKNYYIPIILKYFSATNIKKNTIDNVYYKEIIFEAIEEILKNNFSLKNIIIFHAIKKIPKLLSKEKKKKSLLGFDDLLTILLTCIKKEKFIKTKIIQKYPVAFIDEFQDTDMQQYKIFNLIYEKNKEIALFLIGDPKQAIYSFRGADIFSYLYAKSKIKNHYYLDTNWRSSIDMCNSINFLFSRNSNPFLFKNISFIPTIPSSKNSKIQFKIKGIPQNSLELFFQEKKDVDIKEYHNWIAKQCANEISYWLNCAKNGDAILSTQIGERVLKESDIAVLVRNQQEADIIQKSLKKMNILSIYSSQKKNIFKTFEAQELLWILQSILEPTNKNLLQQSLSTHILKNLKEIELLKKQSYFLIEKLYEYYDIWEKIGIFHMIKSIILEYQINFNCVEIEINYKKNIKFLHIAKLLEEKNQYFYKKSSLIRWFEKKILQENNSYCNEHIRFFNESKLIKIITIHKSKGLEYPIVWIPFSIDFNPSKLSIYHNEKNFQIFFDTQQSMNNFEKSEKERLSEDLRLLYVAVTRSIFHCSIGMACLIKNKTKTVNNKSDVHKSALGYIIQHGHSMNYNELVNELNKLNTDHNISIKNNITGIKLFNNEKKIYLVNEPNVLNKKINQIWKITSFTQLNQENVLIKNLQKKRIKKNILIENQTKNKQNLTIHTFPKGLKSGLLIHYILKNFNFTKRNDNIWFSNILDMYNFSTKWTSVLIPWINSIVDISLNNKNIILSKLQEKEYTKEFEFFLPIKKTIYSSKLNEIVQSFDRISFVSPEINFNPVTGILRGFIDLIFVWKNKYYILDYKSNWLGTNNNFYCNKYLKKEMIKHRYDIQYQIYAVAAHQYLKQRIKKYNYKKNFGGIFYIFLRAIENNKKNNGIFYCMPKYELIKNLLFLFSNKKQD